jgi:hypothetical protein
VNFHYHLSYDNEKDDFWAYIDDGTKHGPCVFQIDNTPEICDYIRTGQMKHIDDVEGLEAMLKEQGILQSEDSLLLSEEVVF